MEDEMRRILLSLVIFFLLSAADFAIGETMPSQAVPQGALVVASKWALDGDTPKGFTKEIKEGQPQVALENGFLRLSSNKTSFGFKREVKASIKKYPYLNWSWQARRLPRGGDFRKRETDDQAGQLYVLFPRFPAKVNTLMVGYLWESEVPKGTSGTSTAWSKLKYIVLRDKTDPLGTWYRESRNVYEDFKRLFGEEPPDLGAVALYINSQHTGSEAEILYGPIYFTREPLKP
jgi:hypothetical protein